MHVAFALFEREPVEGLCFGDCAEGGNGHNLRLSAGEDCASVRTV
ncbi:hypothetical protein SDC9_166152 [bioreactor metagenome]|uniref:Uncharacterized protein n=1 Tax=bioreactor metagenome TaxID=1076179 RepID=A0A645FYT5_9ZZZZ